MTRPRIGLRRRLLMLLGVPVVAAAGLGITHPLTTLAASSSTVGYLTTQTTFSLWIDDFNLLPVADGGTYTLANPQTGGPTSVTIRNVSMTQLDVPAPNTYLSSLNINTLVMYAVCDTGAHTNAIKAINAFLDAGNKVIILDGAQCTSSGTGNANYSAFEKPFTSTYGNPAPPLQPATSGPYTAIESGLTDKLTTGLPDCGSAPCNEPGNSLSDASVLSPNSTGWCQSLAGTTGPAPPPNTNVQVTGAVEAYNRGTTGNSLIVYEGEAFAWTRGTTANQAHLRLVFDNTLTQAWNPDLLSCSHPLGGPPPVAETHLAIFIPVIGFVVVVGGLLLTMVRRRRRVFA